jgi:hypothetical protein
LRTKLDQEKRKSTINELYSVLAGVSKAFIRTFIVFDALDECDRRKQREVLLPICHQMGEVGLNVFITSRRFVDDIEESFRAVPTIRIQAYEDDIRG